MHSFVFCSEITSTTYFISKWNFRCFFSCYVWSRKNWIVCGTFSVLKQQKKHPVATAARTEKKNVNCKSVSHKCCIVYVCEPYVSLHNLPFSIINYCALAIFRWPELFSLLPGFFPSFNSFQLFISFCVFHLAVLWALANTQNAYSLLFGQLFFSLAFSFSRWMYFIFHIVLFAVAVVHCKSTFFFLELTELPVSGVVFFQRAILFWIFFRVCRCSFSWVWDLAWIGYVCVFREIVFGGATITISIFIGLPSSKSVCNKPTVSCCSFFRWCPVYFVYSYSSLFILSLHTHSSKKNRTI